MNLGRSLLTGPIPPTPGYEYGDRPSSAPTSSQAFARVHGSDAKAIHRRAMNGTGVPFLFEVQGMGLSSTHGSAASMNFVLKITTLFFYSICI